MHKRAVISSFRTNDIKLFVKLRFMIILILLAALIGCKNPSVPDPLIPQIVITNNNYTVTYQDIELNGIGADDDPNTIDLNDVMGSENPDTATNTHLRLEIPFELTDFEPGDLTFLNFYADGDVSVWEENIDNQIDRQFDNQSGQGILTVWIFTGSNIGNSDRNGDGKISTDIRMEIYYGLIIARSNIVSITIEGIPGY